jgi:hypothetical protein
VHEEEEQSDSDSNWHIFLIMIFKIDYCYIF